jgi:hypothetical protein
MCKSRIRRAIEASTRALMENNPEAGAYEIACKLGELYPDVDVDEFYSEIELHMDQRRGQQQS